MLFFVLGSTLTSVFLRTYEEMVHSLKKFKQLKLSFAVQFYLAFLSLLRVCYYHLYTTRE